MSLAAHRGTDSMHSIQFAFAPHVRARDGVDGVDGDDDDDDDARIGCVYVDFAGGGDEENARESRW